MADSSGKGEVRETSTKFENFDVLPDVPSDHHFLLTWPISSLTNRTIAKEWKSLSKNLPESIYVRVYEPSTHLLRAAIVGSAGTPYHDGLFFFDIALPIDYPNQPPSVYYHAHGYSLNPNLYADGMVCLSLINTWFGRQWGTESTILQLLVSLQGLVLNERPYFNEPVLGIWKRSRWAAWRNASNAYNEQVFILSCMTMLKVKAKPPQGFKDFVDHHFRERSASILAAVDAYEQGRVVCGQFQVDGEYSSSTCVGSAKFKANLRVIRQSLEAAFGQSATTPRTVLRKRVENAKEGSNSSIKGKHIKKKTGFWASLNCFT